MHGRDGRTIALEQHTDTFSCKNARMHLNKAGYTAQHKLWGLGRGRNVVGRGIGGSHIHDSISLM